jgi:hypothetical protein
VANLIPLGAKNLVQPKPILQSCPKISSEEYFFFALIPRSFSVVGALTATSFFALPPSGCKLKPNLLKESADVIFRPFVRN